MVRGKLTDVSFVSLLLKASARILTLLITQVSHLMPIGSLFLVFVWTSNEYINLTYIFF